MCLASLAPQNDTVQPLAVPYALLALPADMTSHIFAFVDLPELHALAQTSKAVKKAVDFVLRVLSQWRFGVADDITMRHFAPRCPHLREFAPSSIKYDSLFLVGVELVTARQGGKGMEVPLCS